VAQKWRSEVIDAYMVETLDFTLRARLLPRHDRARDRRGGPFLPRMRPWGAGAAHLLPALPSEAQGRRARSTWTRSRRRPRGASSGTSCRAGWTSSGAWG